MGLLKTLSTGFLIESAGKAVGHVVSGLNSRAEEKSQQPPMPTPDIRVEVQAGHAGELKELKCPHCNACVQIPAGRGVVYCMYCGSQLHFDDGSVSVTYRAVDEGRLREAEMKNALEMKRLEIEEKRRPGRIKLSIGLGVFAAIMAIIAGVGGNYWFGLVALLAVASIMLIWMMADNDRSGGDDE